MNIIIACEYSGVVREAFKEKGHNVISCDLLPTEQPGIHYQGDIFSMLREEAGHFNSKRKYMDWADLLIGHPECKFLANSGVQWLYNPADANKPENLRRVHPNYPDRWANHYEAVIFFKKLWELPIPKIALENPIPSVRLTRVVGKYNQIVQPHWFGDPYTKATCLWLKNLPKLTRETYFDKSEIIDECHKMGPSKDRSKDRAKTYPGVARAMAETWGK